MNLQLNSIYADSYKNKSQLARVITEKWTDANAFCPVCGNSQLSQFEANRPVADLYCKNCNSEFELKSKESTKGVLPDKINDGAYETMISRITSMNNPHLLMLIHSSNVVTDFLLIPKYFFTPAIIQKRAPLSQTARRAGWIGCNIIIGGIPSAGKISIVKNHLERPVDEVVAEYNKVKLLKTKNLDKRGWLMDILSCVDRITSEFFSLAQIYEFYPELEAKHPGNNFVHEKIRQQLQFLRDKGFIEFVGNGVYKKK